MAAEPQGSMPCPPPPARKVPCWGLSVHVRCPTQKGHHYPLHKGAAWDRDSLVRRPTDLPRAPAPGMSQKLPEGNGAPSLARGGRAHQDQLPVIGQLSGPGGLGTLPLQKPLLTDHLVLTLPFHQALREGGSQVSRPRSRDAAVGRGGEVPPFCRLPPPRDFLHQRWREGFRKRPGSGQGRCAPRDSFTAPTLQGLPSTVCSSNSSPTLKLISVVRTEVEVLM